MRILLDTHIFLWWDNEPSQLSAQAKALCQDSANDLVLSVASVWEMQIKLQIGKLSLRLPLSELIKDQQKTNGIGILPVTLAHALALEALPLHHKDPFDRLLIAQSNIENIGLLNIGPMFKPYQAIQRHAAWLKITCSTVQVLAEPTSTRPRCTIGRSTRRNWRHGREGGKLRLEAL